MSTLYIVPTPIGNLGDITQRSIETLTNIPIIACEDTRVAGKLLNLLGIDSKSKQLINYSEPNEIRTIPRLIDILSGGDDIALISDSGTPLLSDPGFKLVREIRQNYSDSIQINVLPGASSITTALVASGLPTDKFTFIGFLPNKSGKRENFLEKLKEADKLLSSTYIAFESPHRIIKAIETMNEVFADEASICICREMTKLHEQVFVGTSSEILEGFKAKKISQKGEFVIVFNLNN